MKDISLIKKHKVIKMFFSGFTYDEIALELGIAKGSVVNIIDDFKTGELPIAPDEYIDALRELAVDLRKQHTTVKQLKMYDKIHQKLAEMGVGIEKVDDWLDIVQDIATETASTKAFVTAALQLAQMEIETGHNPGSLVTEFKSNSEALKKLKAQVEETTKNNEKAAAKLDAINKAIAAAQEKYNSQIKELKSKLDDFIDQNQLSWNKANLVIAILDGELAKEELGQEEIKKISKQIAKTGSLVAYNKNAEKENMVLQEHNIQLKDDTYKNEMANTGSQKMFSQLASQVLAKLEERKAFNSQLKEIKLQLSELKIIKHKHAEDIYTGWLILTFLADKHKVSDYDFDRLVEMLNGIRLARLGEKPKQVMDAKGKVICQCHVPMPYTPIKDYSIAVDKAQSRLAEYLVPLVKEKFVPKFEYETNKLMQEITEMSQHLIKALSGQPGNSSQSESVGQKTPEETDSVEEPDKAANPDKFIPEQTAVPESNLYYSQKAIKARLETDKKFIAQIGPSTCSTPYPWKGDQ